MSASDEDKCKQVAGPVIVTVHGTFAGNLRENPPHHWWQSEATLALQLIQKLGSGAIVQPFQWKDKERTGPNRESERKIAGRQLFKELLELEDKGISYHLVGHSHGGSVISHARSTGTGRRRTSRRITNTGRSNMFRWLLRHPKFVDKAACRSAPLPSPCD